MGLACLLFPPAILTKIWMFPAGSDDAEDAEDDRDRMMERELREVEMPARD